MARTDSRHSSSRSCQRLGSGIQEFCLLFGVETVGKFSLRIHNSSNHLSSFMRELGKHVRFQTTSRSVGDERDVFYYAASRAGTEFNSSFETDSVRTGTSSGLMYFGSMLGALPELSRIICFPPHELNFFFRELDSISMCGAKKFVAGVDGKLHSSRRPRLDLIEHIVFILGGDVTFSESSAKKFLLDHGGQ
jgi:hypothetical protein